MMDSLRILLIEDDKVDARNFERVLGKTGFQYSFTHLTDVEEGFKSLQENSYDLVFLDYHMPKGNGLTLLKSIKGIGLSVPVVIITSYADPHVAVEMIQSGATDYIPKSLLSVDGLAQCIRSSVKFKQLEKKTKETETQLRKVENRLGTIISNAPVILFVLDQFGTIQLGMGKHWESFSPVADSVIGLAFDDVFSDYPKLISAYEKSLKGKTEKCECEINEIIYEITFTPILDKKGEIKEVIGLSLDITDHFKGQESLRKAKQIAENASQMKQEFIANMSHEIRTPMNAIIGFTNLLAETEMSVIQGEFLKAIKTSGENLLSLINDILDFSKIEAGKLSIENEDFVLHDVVESVIRVLDSKAIEKKLSLKLDINSNVPKAVKGDRTRLYQILMNLVGNSIKFTPKGKVEVLIGLGKEKVNSVELEFKVNDTGVGIPKEKQALIFESFMQVEGKSNRKVGGTGLGLTIVKNLVELMKGEISVESELGEGTSFTFKIPFEFADNLNLAEENTKDKSEKYKKLKGKKILLAEDNAMNQKLVLMYLKKYELDIDLAETGIQALKAVRSNDYDLILMDIQMPDMDGIEATDEIRRKLPESKNNVPILAMTAHAFKEEIEKCFDVGMNAHISKPIDKNDFLTLISSLILTDEHAEVRTRSNDESEKNENPLVDLSYLRDMAEGNEGFVHEMIKIFKSDSPKLIQEMRGHFESENWKDLGRIAHKYRSPAVMMGMKEVALLAEKVEYNDYSQGNFEEIEELITEIEKRSQEAIDYIQSNF